MNNNINVYALSKSEGKKLDRELRKVIKAHSKNRVHRPKRPIEIRGQR